MVPDWQRRIHVATEALAVFVFTPWLLSAAADARGKHRDRLRLMAAGTLLVDGFLLYRWLTAPELQPQIVRTS